MQEFEFLEPTFLAAMNDIGRYGYEKYAEASTQHRRQLGDTSRGDSERTQSAAIMEHAKGHADAYLRGELHDHFETKLHQLAAVAFNAMMEAYFARLA